MHACITWLFAYCYAIKNEHISPIVKTLSLSLSLSYTPTYLTKSISFATLFMCRGLPYNTTHFSVHLLGLDLKPIFRKFPIGFEPILAANILIPITYHSAMSYFCRHVEVGFEPMHFVQQ